MKVCLECCHRFEGTGWECPNCHVIPVLIDGRPAFAPNLALTNDGFRSDYFEDLAKLENDNFWFRARNRLIVWALHRYFKNAESFLEIGCGTGFVLYGISERFSHLKLWGSEIFSAGLEYVAKRTPRAEIFQMDARSVPFVDEFDIIGAFDVLEHVQEDDLVLKQCFKAIRPGGGIILTVPQHMLLWGPADEHACHVRRYNLEELRIKVQQAGFTVVRVSSFVSLLFPIMVVSRFKSRMLKKKYDPFAELKLSQLTNSLFEKVLDLEQYFIRKGMNFPFGGSLILVARKL